MKNKNNKIDRLYKRVLAVTPAVYALQAKSEQKADDLLFSIVPNTDVETATCLFDRLNNDLRFPWLVNYWTAPCQCCGDETIYGTVVKAAEYQKMPAQWYVHKYALLGYPHAERDEGIWVYISDVAERIEQKCKCRGTLIGEVAIPGLLTDIYKPGHRLTFERFNIKAIQESM